MTVPSTVNSVSYIGTGATGPFPFSFRILQEADLIVTTTDPQGNVVTLVLDSDYTLVGAAVGLDPFGAGGSITLAVGLTAGWELDIARFPAILQETSFGNAGEFFAKSHEDAFDLLTMVAQALDSKVGGVIPQPPAVILDAFNSPGDFTAGVTTFLTLSSAPQTLSNLSVSMRTNGVVVAYESDQYTILGKVITFTVAIPALTTRVEVKQFATLVGTSSNDAANITYKPAGAGSVSTTVQVQLRREAYVQNFGAKGDGATDDTASFNAGVVYLNSLGGGRLIVPPSATPYMINPDFNGGKSINLLSGVYLEVRAGAVVQCKANALDGASVVYALGQTNCGVIGEGVIDGNRNAHTGAPSEQNTCLQFNTCSNVRVSGVRLINAEGDGLLFSCGPAPLSGHECVNFEVEGVRIDNCRRNGCSVVAGIRGRFTNCDFNGANGTAPQAGVDLEPDPGTAVVQDIVLTGCTYSNNTNYGVAFAGSCTDCAVIGGSARNNGVYGVNIGISAVRSIVTGLTVVQAVNTSAGITMQFGQGAIISDCQVSGTFLYGIWVRGGASYATNGKVLVRGCMVTGDGVTTSYGIFISNNAGRTTVSGCSVASCHMGIRATTSDWSSVVGCQSRLNSQYGISIEGCQYVTVSGCVSEGNTLIGISLNSACFFCTVTGSVSQGNGADGIGTTANSADCAITACVACENSQTTDNTSDNITSAGTRTLIQGNVVRQGNKVNKPRYGIFIAAGTDSKCLSNDVQNGGKTSNFHDAGTTSYVCNNPGYNPIGISNVAATGSPQTFINGPSPATFYVHGGTVSAIAKSGPTILAATNCSVDLGPNETVTVTYSVNPTMEVDVH